jgi:cardiolipin synthase A/B
MVSGRRNDNWLARRNSVRLYGPLLDAGIEILEYNRSMLHHKVMVVDGCWMTIGTSNFDNRSFAHNEESNLSIVNGEEARRFEARFDQDRAACAVVRKAAWEQRGVGWRLQELLASVFREQV